MRRGSVNFYLFSGESQFFDFPMYNHENLRFVDAIGDAYFHKCSVAAASKKHKVDRRRLALLLRDMPRDLPPDGVTSNRFLRYCYTLLGITANHVYTTVEMQYALTEAIFNMKSYQACENEYGVAERTMCRHIGTICKEFHCENRRLLHDKCNTDTILSVSVVAYISNMCYNSHMGPKPYLTQTERDLFFSLSNERKKLGSGDTRTQLAVSVT